MSWGNFSLANGSSLSHSWLRIPGLKIQTRQKLKFGTDLAAWPQAMVVWPQAMVEWSWAMVEWPQTQLQTGPRQLQTGPRQCRLAPGNCRRAPGDCRLAPGKGIADRGHQGCKCWLQGYAWEITTPEGGWGLHDVLKARQDKLNGIVNGIDMAEWDPAHDTDTEAPYTSQDLAGEALGSVSSVDQSH